MPTCLLVRHGRSTANTEGVLAGWTPGVHLDDLGREQASRLAERLGPLTLAAVVSSPLTRCRETADVLADGAPVTVEDGLGECRYGAWTGRALKDLAGEELWRTVQEHPSRAAFPPSQDYPGESLAAMSHRAVAAVRARDEEVRAEHGEDAIWVAVTHGDVIKAVLADAVGCHLDHFQRFRADPASVSAVLYTPRRPFLVVANDTGADLRRLVPPAPTAETAAETAGGSGAAGTAGSGGPGREASGGSRGDAVVGGGAG